MTGYAGFGIADEQQGNIMGKPPWMRQTRVTADGKPNSTTPASHQFPVHIHRPEYAEESPQSVLDAPGRMVDGRLAGTVRGVHRHTGMVYIPDP